MAVSQVFTTTGLQTWNWPAGVTSVTAEALGGGGGSGTGSGNPATGGGGMGGSYAKAVITKGADTLLTIVVGTGGAIAGAGAASTVVQAGTTRVAAPGGAGGATQAASSANGAGGTTQNGTPVGTTLFSGGAGGTGNFTSGTQGSGAGGGAAGPTSAGGAASVNVAGIVGTGAWLNGNTYQVAGRAGVGNTTPGIAGINYGGAASGGKASTGADQNGAVGAQGIVVLTWTPPDQAVTTNFLASTEVANAAWVSPDILVVAGISTATARANRTVVFPTPTVGYVFYLNSSGVFGYSKTTDGGATWGAFVDIVSGGGGGVAFDIWFDQWTPGDSGTLIHCWWFDNILNRVFYRTVNTANDAMGISYQVFTGASAVAGRGAFVSGTKTRSGYLYCAYDIDAGTERGFHRSTNGGPVWSANLATTFIEATLDTCKLFPASGTGDDNDCWALYYDQSALALTLKLWDSSAVAQVESATIGVAHTDGPTDLTGQYGYDAVVRHTDGHLIVAALSGRDVAASQHQVFDITSTSTITTKTSIAASTDDHYYPQVFINQGTGTIFVAYNGKRDGSEVLDTTSKVYFTYSTDGGTTWAAGDTAYQVGDAVAVQQVWNGMSGSRFYTVWRVGTQLWGSFVNSLVQLGAQGATILSSAQLNVPTVINTLQLVATAFRASEVVLNKPTVVGGDVTVPPSVPAWQQGFNFRSTAGFVTDKIDQTYVLTNTTYPTVRNGVTFGWTYGPYDSRDRLADATHSPELAGTNFNLVDVGAPVTFRVDLPAPGDYIIRLALGDQAFPKQDAGCAILDDTTTVLTIPKQAIATDTWVDASNIARSPTVWKTSNGAVIRTFSSTKLILALTNPTTGTSDISHLSIKSVTSVTDTFDRADSATLGPDWTATDSNMQIVSNEAKALVDSAYNFVYRSKERYDLVDHASEATFVQHGASGDDTICMLNVRCQPNGDMYSLWLHSIPGDRRFSLMKRIAGVWSNIGDFVSGAPQGVPVDGHRYRLEASGTALRMFDNDVQVGPTYTDADLVAGMPGHGVYMHGVAWNDWKGYGVLDKTPLDLTGCVGWWNLNEGSGNALDSHTNALNLTETGGTIPRVVMGKRFGRQFSYASPFKHFEFPDNDVLSFGTSFTITTRFAFLGGPGFDNFAMLGKSVYPNIEWLIYYRNGDSGGGPAGEDFWGLKFGIEGVGTVAIPDAAWSGTGTIHTLVCWFDQPNGIMGMRLDDSVEYLKTGLTGSATNGTSPFKIGYGYDGNAEAWSGPLSTVTLWRRLFTAAEKTAIHNKGDGLDHADVEDTGGGGPTTKTVAGATIGSASALNVPTVVLATGPQPVIGTTLASTATLAAPTVSVAHVDLTPNLVGHWPMNESGPLSNALDVHGGNALTLRDNGGGNIGQNPIDGTPARDVELNSDNVFYCQGAPALAFTTDQAFTLIMRFKVESIDLSNGWLDIVTKSHFAGHTNVHWYVAWSFPDLDFRVYNPAGVPSSYCSQTVGTPVIGATYVVACGHDPVTDKIWVRLNNNARTEIAWAGGTRNNEPSDFVVGDVGVEMTDEPTIDGAVGPISYFKRSLTDAEVDSWISVKGDYVGIGGIVAQSITGTTVSATATLSAPIVRRASDLTLGMVGHWPFNESSASANVADVHGANPLTRHGTNTVAQNPIDGTPARDMELDTGTYFEHANNADLNVAGNQPWTLVMRCTFESITDVAIGLADKIASGATLSGNWGIYWDSGEGFSGWGTGSTQLAFANTNPAHLTLTPGATYVVAGGYDPALQKVWVRVNHDARVYADLAETTGDASDTFAVGMFFGPTPTWLLDGGAGPLSFWKRVLTDAELDHWISVKGDYASIGGTVPDQSVAGAAIASTLVAYTPGVYPATDLTSGLVSHWKTDEVTGAATALDAVGTNHLTMNGTAPSGQNPIEGTPARDLEKDNLNNFSIAETASLSIADGQSFSFIARVKLESYTSSFYVFAKDKAGTTTQDWGLTFYSGRFHFIAYDAARNFYATGSTEFVSDPTGKAYTIACGYDASRSMAWCRIFGNEFTGLRGEVGPFTLHEATSDTFRVGGTSAPAGVDYTVDGGIGPISMWNRVLTDAEIDYWVGVKGDYVKIGGSGGAQSVAGATIASQLVLTAPTVIVPLDLTLGMVGHWPFNESSGNALDQHATNPFTAHSTSAQDPIDGTPAREIEFSTGDRFALTHDSSLAFNSDQPFSFIVRLKFESKPQRFMYFLSKYLRSNPNFNFDFSAYWHQGEGFGLGINDSTGFNNVVATPGVSNEFAFIEGHFGETYVVAGGHDPVTDTVWIRVNGQPRVAITLTAGTRNVGDTYCFGDLTDSNGSTTAMDGAGGPLSMWKRVLTDAEIDYWTSVKGDYAAIGGGGSPPAQTVLATTIATTQQLRVPTVAPGAVTVAGVTLASASALNVPSVTTGAVTVTGTTISAGNQRFAPSVAVTLTVATLGSLSTVFAPSSVTQTVTTAHRATTQQLFTATVALAGVQDVTSATLGGGSVLRVPVVTPGPVTISTAFMSGGLVNAPSVTAGAVFVGGVHQATTQQLFTASVGVGPVTVLAATQASTATLFLPAVTAIAAGSIGAATLVSAAEVNAPSVVGGLAIINGATLAPTSIVRAPSAAVGPVTLSGVTLASAAQAFTPSIAVGPVAVLGATLAAASQLFLPLVAGAGITNVAGPTIPAGSVVTAPTASVGAVTILAATLATALVLLVPSVAPGAVTVDGATRASTTQLFTPTVAAGAVTVLAPTQPPSNQVFTPTLAHAVTTLFLATASQPFAPTVLGANGIAGASLPSGLQLFGATVTTGAVTVVGGTVSSAVALFTPSIGVAAITISGGTVPAASALYPPSFIARLDGTFIGATTQLFTPTVQPTQFVSAVFLPTGLTLFEPSTLPVTTVTGATLAATSLLRVPSVAVGPVTILGATFPSQLVLTPPSLGVGSVSVTTAHRASTAALTTPTVEQNVVVAFRDPASQVFALSVAAGPVSVQAPTRLSTTQLFAPALGAGVTTGTLINVSALHAPVLTPLVTTALWVETTVLFPPGSAPLGSMFGQHIPSGLLVFPPQMVAFAPPPEILDVVSNIVTATDGDTNMCRSQSGTVILTRGVALAVEVDRTVLMSPSVVRREFSAGIER